MTKEDKRLRDELVTTFGVMRVAAQHAYRDGVEGIISEIRHVAAAAEGAIGEISIDEAFQVIERTVRERVQRLTGWKESHDLTNI